ncbi:galactose-binding domain-like protein, partial [Paraphoma chrysanthemicola]
MPSLRNRAPPPHDQDTDSETDVFPGAPRMGPSAVDDEDINGELVGVEGEDDPSEDDEDLLVAAQTQALNLDPPGPHLREISTLASWTVSSSKPGCSIPQLRHPSTDLFWQSDGPQPHYLNIHFFKLVRIVGLRLYLDFEHDESYTPTRIIFLAGSGMNDLQQWSELSLENPRGWVWVPFDQVGDPDDDDDDNEEGDVRMLDAAPGQEIGTGTNGTAAGAPNHDASSDSENNNPQQQHIDQHQTPQQQQQQQHTPHQHNPNQTPTYHPQTTPSLTTPANLGPNNPHLTPNPHSLPRSILRRPFAALSPNPHPPQNQTPDRMPVLRAHLLQIKILENHQNGKDTHLRGLQVFARSEEKEGRGGVRRREMGGGLGCGLGGAGGGVSGGVGGRGKRKDEDEDLDKYELGNGGFGD